MANKRKRRTQDEMAAVRLAIKNVLKSDHPQTVRQVFYQLVTRGVIEKTEQAYKGTVVRLLVEMRLDGAVPWGRIVDESRRTQGTRTFNNISDALENTAKYYRRSAMRESDVYIEVWTEKEALAGIIWDAASEFDVLVIASKGMPSLTSIYTTFSRIKAAAKAGKQSFIYQFGDHDPTGCLIPKTIKDRLEDFCDQSRIERPVIERIALTEEQIEEYALPMRPTKRDGNHHAQAFEGDSVELDALPSATLRELVTDCVERHISQQQLDTLREAEASEREILEQLAADHYGE
jgi:DNA topoisomerase VI subunit A